MNDKEKDLIYYEGCELYDKSLWHFNRRPKIKLFKFRNVKTGEYLKIGGSFYKELVEEMGYKFYENVLEAEKDFDILWDKTSTIISPLTQAYEEVREEYENLLKQNIPSEQINEIVLNKYNPEPCQGPHEKV